MLDDSKLELQNRQQDIAREEFANCLTHGGGLLLSLVAAYIVIDRLAETTSGVLRVGCWVYALGMVAVYAASTLSHAFENPIKRHYFRRLDQGVIFIFITASFTPFSIAFLHDTIWWVLLAIMWAIALVGFCSKLFWGYRVEATAITHYLALGWLPVAATKPILEALPTAGVFWCIVGGLFYTVGTLFLALDSKVRYFHAVWHVFVIVGSYCHFLVIIDYVIPPRV